MTDKVTIEMTPYEYAIFIAGLYVLQDDAPCFIGSDTISYAYEWADRLQEKYGQPNDDLLTD